MSGLQRGFGRALAALGVLGLLGGFAIAGYASLNQQDNSDRQVQDKDRTAVNNELMQRGIIGASIAFIGLVIGILLLLFTPTQDRRGGRTA